MSVELIQKMTIVIGIQTREGAVLASDCRSIRVSMPYNEDGDVHESRAQERKIHHGLMKSQDGLYGAYLAECGTKWPFGGTSLFTESLERETGLAELLTHPWVRYARGHILTHLDHTQRLADENPQDADLQWQIRILEELATIKSFLEHKRGRGEFSLEHLILRLRINNNPDLIRVENAYSVLPVLYYEVMGSGEPFARPVVEKGYFSGIGIEEATILAISALNATLTGSDDFQGYQIVQARRENGRNLVKTAIDMEARRVGEVIWKDPWFN